MSKILIATASALLAVAVQCAASYATSIPVTNYSFESPNLGGPGGSYTNAYSISGWNFSSSNNFDVEGVQNQGPNGGGGPPTGNPIRADPKPWGFVNLSNNGP